MQGFLQTREAVLPEAPLLGGGWAEPALRSKPGGTGPALGGSRAPTYDVPT